MLASASITVCTIAVAGAGRGSGGPWYEADRMAMAFAGPDLPVPEVREVGTTPSGRVYAISVRHHGRFLEDTPVEQAGAIAPTLTRLLEIGRASCRERVCLAV